METATQRTATQAMGAIPRYAAGGPMRLKKPAKPGAASVMATGGAIKGKGTGTSDEIPILASNGEYMIRAAAVEEIGTEVLDAINKLGDDNEPDEAMEAKDGKPAMKKGGAVRCMAGGGPIGTALEPYVNHRFYTPPPSTALATLPPEPYRPNFTMGANQAAPVPESSVTDVRAKYNPANGSPEAKAWQASRGPAATPPVAPNAPVTPAAGPSAGSRMTEAFKQFTGVNGTGAGSKVLGAAGKLGAGALNFAGKLAMPLAVGNEALQVGQVAMDPNSTGNDIAAQAAQGFGRLGAAGAGAAAGAALGSVVPVVGTAIGGLAGGVLGYLGADKAIEAGRSALGVDPRAPATRAPSILPTATPPTAAPIPTAAAPAAPQPRPGAPNPASGSPEEVMPSGKVNVTKQANGVMSFSGKDITGQPQYTGSAANTMQGGAMNTMQAMPQAEINRALTNPDGSRWSANDNAIMAANIRDGVNPYRGTSRGIAEAAQNDLQNLALSPNGTPGKGNAMKLLAMQADDKRSAAQQQIEKDRNAQTAQGQELDNKSKQQVLAAQQELANAKTPEEEAAAEKKLRALQGKYGKETPEQYAYAPGGQSIDPVTGQTVTQPGVIFNKATGEVKQPGQTKSIEADPRAIAIRDNKTMTREQKLAELKKIGYQ